MVTRFALFPDRCILASRSTSALGVACAQDGGGAQTSSPATQPPLLAQWQITPPTIISKPEDLCPIKDIIVAGAKGFLWLSWKFTLKVKKPF